MTGRIKAEDKIMVAETFGELSISHLAQRVFQNLSDGEKQRVLIARAIVQGTPFIFMDEPVAYVDSPGKIGVMHLISQLATKYGKGVLMATHDIESAFNHADRLWLLGEEKAFLEGSPVSLIENDSVNKFFDRDHVVFDKESRRFIFKP
jgi:iron complex transport system ATP-binding protein